MSDQAAQFNTVAQRLARNPLGVIALFIVLVDSLAAIVIAFGDGLSVPEKLPLIYFMVIFPVAVLVVFTWLVVKHTTKLFAPSDFQDEENYMKTVAAVSLTAASFKKGSAETQTVDIDGIAASVREATTIGHGTLPQPWRSKVLWVDDTPENNRNERQALEAMGISFTLARSTREALDQLSHRRFAAIISDMGRPEGPAEGYVLLDELRATGNETPYFIYSSSGAPQHRRETLAHGGQGNTNSPQKLFRLVMKSIVSR